MRPTILAVLVLTACAPPPVATAPAPIQLVTARPSATVVRLAVATLAAQGFTPTVSDAVGGIAVATREARSADEMKAWFACPWGPDAVGWRMAVGTMTVTVTASPHGDSTAVSITGTGAQRGNPSAGMLALNTPVCASNGAAERLVADAITR